MLFTVSSNWQMIGIRLLVFIERHLSLLRLFQRNFSIWNMWCNINTIFQYDCTSSSDRSKSLREINNNPNNVIFSRCASKPQHINWTYAYWKLCKSSKKLTTAHHTKNGWSKMFGAKSIAVWTPRHDKCGYYRQSD